MNSKTCGLLFMTCFGGVGLRVMNSIGRVLCLSLSGSDVATTLSLLEYTVSGVAQW